MRRGLVRIVAVAVALGFSAALSGAMAAESAAPEQTASDPSVTPPPAPPAPPAQPTQPEQPTAAKEDSDLDVIVCRKEEATVGSRLGARKVCKTRRQWRDERRDATSADLPDGSLPAPSKGL